MSHFQVDGKRLDPDCYEVRIAGELDLAVADRLREELGSADGVQMLIDLGECEFIDSTGLAVIIQAQQELSERGGRLLVHSPSDQVLRVLSVTGLTDNGLVVPSRAEALSALGLSEQAG